MWGQAKLAVRVDGQSRHEQALLTFGLFAGVAQQTTRVAIVEFQFRPGSLEPLFHFLDVLRRSNILWRCPADTFDGVAHLFSDLFMCLNSVRLALDTITRQLIASLGHAELIGGEFGGVHAVEQVVFVGNGLAHLDGIPPYRPLYPAS